MLRLVQGVTYRCDRCGAEREIYYDGPCLIQASFECDNCSAWPHWLDKYIEAQTPARLA